MAQRASRGRSRTLATSRLLRHWQAVALRRGLYVAAARSARLAAQCLAAPVSGPLGGTLGIAPLRDLRCGKEISVQGWEGQDSALADVKAFREGLKVGAESLNEAGAER